MKTKIFTTTFLVILVLCNLAKPQDGTPDSSYGTNGTVIIDAGFYKKSRNAVMQSDGKIVMVGQAYPATNQDVAVTRVNPDGSPDSTFDSDGKLTTMVGYGAAGDMATSVAIQTDGKLVVGGYTSETSGTKFILLRYNSNGTLDNTFSGDGIFITTLIGFGNAVSVLNDGKILLAGTGSTTDFSTQRAILARYSDNGTLDNSFGVNGVVGLPVLLSQANVMAVQSDGKIILAGDVYYGPTTYSDISVARYTANGSVDSSFGNNGSVVTDVDSVTNQCVSAILQSDGKILVTGKVQQITDNAISDILLIRYNTNGTLDTSFASVGYVKTSIDKTDEGRAVALQSDGKILVAGYSIVNNTSSGVLVRYNTNGSLDTLFGTQGIVYNSDIYAHTILFQNDGKILVGSEGFQLSRYNNTIPKPQAIRDFTEQNHGFTIFPNPTEGKFRIVNKKPANNTYCEIYNLLGKKLLSLKNLSSVQPVDISYFSTGIYFVKIYDGKKFYTRKIVVQ